MRRWWVTCPYCKVTIAEGAGSGDSFPKIWLPFIRCHSCGGLIDTGSREFLTIPVEERLRLKNTGKISTKRINMGCL